MTRPTFDDWKDEQLKDPKFREEYDKLEGKIVLHKSLNVKISIDVLDKLRDYIYWTPGITINSFVEECIKESLDKKGMIEKRKEELKAGRKIK